MMSRRLRLTLAFVFSGTLIPSALAFADSGLIQCSGALSCTLCAGVTVMQLLINGAIILAFPIAAVLLAYAGGLMMTSAANPSGLQKSKDIMKSVAIGFGFVLLGWLIIDTLLHVIIINQNKNYFPNNTWNSVGDCSSLVRPTNKLVGDLLNGLFAPSSPTAGQLEALQGNGTGNGGGTTGKVTDPDLSAKLTSACSTYSVDCTLASGIASVESGGGKNCDQSSSGAVGCMQVLATTACTLDSSISSSCSACLNSKNSLSSDCGPVRDAVSNDKQLGANLGVNYISKLENLSSLKSLESQYGTCQIVAAAYFQGPGNVIKAKGVPSNATDYVSKACK